MKPKRRRDLPPEEWQTVAAKMREATEALAALDALLDESLTVAGMAPYRKAFGRVQVLRSRLDGLRAQQHPTWPEGDRLFFGCGWTYNATWR